MSRTNDPSWSRRLWRRLRPGSPDLDRELQAHLDLEIEDQREHGLSPAEARRAAHQLLGNRTRVSEEVRNMSPMIWWERAVQDLRYGARGLRRHPAFAVAGILSLALGIGANTAIFSVTNAVLLRTLEVSRPEELALVTNGNIGDYSYPVYRALREDNRTFAHLMAASSARRYPAEVGGESEQVFVKMVSGNYFAGLDVSPAAGRVLAQTDELEPVAVLSFGYWQRRFGAATDVVGRQVSVNGVPVTIVGVGRAGFTGEAPGESPDIWTSLALQAPASRDERGFTWLYLMGRLKPGSSLEQAQSDLAAARIRIQPEASADTPFKEALVTSGARGSAGLRDRIAAPITALMVTSGLVLLIACMNLGGLLLTRDEARRPEIAMRLAIGATARRLIRQLMTESLLLAVLGGALGLAFASWSTRALISLVSTAGPGISVDVRMDRTVLLFTALVSIASAVLFGLAPALRAVREGRGQSLRISARALGPGRQHRLRSAFVVAQIALSLALVAAATMFVRTLRNLEGQDLGFDRSDRLIVGITRERGYRPDMSALVPRLLERVGAVPGVEAVTVAAFGTLAENGGGVNGIQVAGFDAPDPQDHRARSNWVGPGYFRATGIPLIGGRDLLPSDNASTQKVAVVSETAARHFFGDRNAVGRRFTFNATEYEVVGVARDAQLQLRDRTPPRLMYFALLQGGSPGFNVLELRTSRGQPTAVAPGVRTAITEVDPRLSALESVSLTTQIDRRLGIERLVARLSGFLSGLTLLLVSIGIYGTLAFTAAKRTKEIGLRLALGSNRASVVWIVLRDVVVLLAAGLAFGALGAFGIGQLVESLLYRLAPMDPVTLAIAVGLLLAVALTAAAVPLIRTSRLDPARILHEP